MQQADEGFGVERRRIRINPRRSSAANRGNASRVFYDPRSLDPDGGVGVLHAKAVVVDDEAAFVTSTNLTEAALDRNIEIGLLVRDRTLAATMTRHFTTLIERSRLPALSG